MYAHPSPNRGEKDEGARALRFFRIGDKVVSGEKLAEQIDDILRDRVAGATQAEVAKTHGVERSFVSWLETLGEVRRGDRIALVGFPIGNIDDVREVAARHGVEYTFLMTQTERESMSAAPADRIFNQVLETLAELKDYDVIVLLASDWRISEIEKILGREVIALKLGPSPLRHDVDVDLSELDDILSGVTAPKGPKAALREAGRGIARAARTRGASATRARKGGAK